VLLTISLFHTDNAMAFKIFFTLVVLLVFPSITGIVRYYCKVRILIPRVTQQLPIVEHTFYFLETELFALFFLTSGVFLIPGTSDVGNYRPTMSVTETGPRLSSMPVHAHLDLANEKTGTT